MNGERVSSNIDGNQGCNRSDKRIFIFALALSTLPLLGIFHSASALAFLFFIASFILLFSLNIFKELEGLRIRSLVNLLAGCIAAYLARQLPSNGDIYLVIIWLPISHLIMRPLAKRVNF